jgi:hypothetical protein
MAAAWNGMLTCDYEHDRPGASPVELELYTRSLIAWPAVILEIPAPYGVLRRLGIVDVPEAGHRRLTGLLRDRLARPAQARDIAARAGAARAAAAAALDAAESRPSSAAALRRAAAAVLPVMSAHIVNWLLPEDHWETLMAKMLGSRTAARTCLATLSVPEHGGHLLARMKTAAQAGSGNSASARTSWLAAALLAAAGDAPSLDAVRGMAITLQWAAESEERRRDLRERFLAATVAWCAKAGLDPAVVTLSDICQTEAE